MESPTKETTQVLLPRVAPQAAPGASARAGAGRWASRRFWTCVALLTLAAVSVQVLPGYVGMFLRKDAVPLRKPLQHLDMAHLGPRYVRHPDTDHLPPLSTDMLDSLGTRDYLQILVTDTQKPNNDPTRVAQIFVTYYTGQPDAVPHVPQECYSAGGWEQIADTIGQVTAAGIGAPHDEIPINVAQFRTAARSRAALGESQVLTVMYFFHVNGDYVCTRDGVRTKLMNPFERYAYYAKIEVNFPGAGAVGAERGRAASLAALAPLLEQLMPVLVNDHFDLRPFQGQPPTWAPGP